MRAGSDRSAVAEIVTQLPRAWRIEKRVTETLLVLDWDRYRPASGSAAHVLPMERANEAAALSALLHREWSLPHDPGRLRVQTERLARDGKIVVCESHGVSVAMSCEVASTGNYVHVGTTVTEPAFRRRGHAAACVCAVLTRARAAGRAERGGVLFTNALNVGAIALYERLGFVREAEWELCFMAAPTSAVTADELSRPR